jgi:hypothetical protein
VLVAAAVCPHPPLLIPAAAGAAGRAADAAPGEQSRDGSEPAAACGTSGGGAVAADRTGGGVVTADRTGGGVVTADRTGGGAVAADRTGGGVVTADRTGGGAVAADRTSGGAEPQPDAEAVLRRVRAACRAAVTGLTRANPDLIVLVGGAAVAGEYNGSAAGSLQDFGVPVTIGSGLPVLPLSLTVGAWLLRSCGRCAGPDDAPAARGRQAVAAPALRLQAVARGTPAPDCLRLGARLAAAAPRVAMLALGDGSARKATGVAGAPDPAADQYDEEVAAALAAADPDRLAKLDAALDDVLSAAGRAAWQVLAGAAAGGRLRGTLRCAVAPFGVSYLVASWDGPPAGLLED